uniref:uncharacterized protein LOC122591984 n=1 Tax=Erigeron canadensis TaxID=72917 RepID=UPI001CB956C8|nr:uncharacterized protein LOC122591984 [Erigeron canadensis]
MFIRIAKDIQTFDAIQPLPPHFQYFHNPPVDVAGVSTLNIFQKCTSVVRQLAYGASAGQLDEYLEMGRQTSYDAMNNFCKCTIQLYHNEYMRKPTQEDVNRVTAKHLEVHETAPPHGKANTLVATGDKGHPTIMLEAVALYDLWIWNAYFGPAGSNNDINILNESDLFDQLLEDRAHVVNFIANGEQFTKGYYLADGIYSEWSTLVKSFKCPMDPKTTKFKRYQEAARKDVERAFGVPQGRFHILTHGARPLSINKIKRMMYSCVILHNMVVDYNSRAISPFDLELIPEERPVRTWDQRVGTQLCMMGELRDRLTHHRLSGTPIEHIWNLPAQQRQR